MSRLKSDTAYQSAVVYVKKAVVKNGTPPLKAWLAVQGTLSSVAANALYDEVVQPIACPVCLGEGWGTQAASGRDFRCEACSGTGLAQSARR